MKYVKILGLLAVVAAAMMAFASSASASKVTGPLSNETPTIRAHSEGHAVLHNPIAKIECGSTAHGKVESHGTPNTPKGNVTVSFFNCTNSWVVDVVASGELEIHVISPQTGTLTSSGATVVATRFGIECRYKTENTTIGHVTGHLSPEGRARLHINGSIPWHGGSALCGGTGPAAWTGTYTTTETLGLDL